MAALRLHVDDLALFRQAVGFTAAETAEVEARHGCDRRIPARPARHHAVHGSERFEAVRGPDRVRHRGQSQPRADQGRGGSPLVPPFRLRCIARREALAEKLRAALSRREVAIRDFYDVDHAVRELGLQPADADMIELVRQKLAVPGNAPVNVSPARLDALRQRLQAELRPVVRDVDFSRFDLDRAFTTVTDVALRVGGRGERVSYWAESERRGERPLAALRLRNTSSLTLEAGPTRVLDGDVHAGEAQLDRLRPGEERFVRYATDLASLVETRTEEGRRLGEELGHENGHARHGRREQLLAGRSLEARAVHARLGVRISRDLDAALLEIDDPVLSDAGASVDA